MNIKEVENQTNTVTNTIELHSIILGSILGDGTFKKYKNVGNRMLFAHSPKQESYCLYKHNIFNKYNLAGKISRNRIFNERYKDGYFDEIRFATRSNNIFIEYYNKFYKDNKRNVLAITNKYFTEQVLAIWYFDDGSICTRSYQITCQSLSEIEVTHMIKLLKDNFNIDSTFDKNHNIYIRTNSINTFNNILNKYVIPEMQYKIRGSV